MEKIKNNYSTELEKTKSELEKAKSFDGYHICYNQGKQTVCSVIEHGYSYGSSHDKLEIMGLLTPAESVNDSVAGWLTADDVFNRIFSAHRPCAQTMKALGIEI